MTLQRCPSALFRRVGAREVVITVDAREDAEVLEGTAADVWHLLTSPRSLGEIVEILAQKYDESPQRVCADVEALIEVMSRRGLIQDV